MTDSSSQPSAATSASGSGNIRLDFLEGIRGVAALCVVIQHLSSHQLFGLTEMRLKTPTFFQTIWPPMRFGVYGLDVFIALSGYCLMLPVARTSDYLLRGGAWEYIKRRAHRILPAYYAALILTLAFFYIAIPMMNDWAPVWYLALNENEALFGFDPESVIAHLFLLHNLKQEWNMQYNGPMWSLAIEWQIYFLLPGMLLPMWRRFRNFAFLPLAFLVSLLPHYLLPEDTNFDWAKPWFLGLFATGMAGALIGFAELPWIIRLRDRTPWLIIIAALMGIWRLRWPEIPHAGVSDIWQRDLFAGVITTCLLIHCARSVSQSQDRKTSLIVRFFESRVLLFIGSFSYSIYLIHYPILHKIAIVLLRQHLTAMAFCVWLWLISLSLILILAYLFYLTFERPFLKTRKPHNDLNN